MALYLTTQAGIDSLPEDPGRDLITGEEWKNIARFAGLRLRESQVGQLIFEGNTREEAAEALQLSPRTIRYYLESLHEKLRVTNRTDLVLRLVQIRDHIRGA